MKNDQQRELMLKKAEESFNLAKKEILKEFIETESKALKLLAESMLLFNVSSEESAKIYLDKLDEFNNEMEKFDEIRTKLNTLVAKKHEFTTDIMRFAFNKSSYLYTMHEFEDEINLLKTQLKESK